jgi:opacity protein-like surface antigen
MPRILLASAAALLAAGPVLAGGFAAPVVVDAPATPVVVPVTPVVTGTDWSGPYVGGQLGFGRLTVEDNDDTTDDEEADGATYGLHAGYMFDFGSIVAGAEVDFDGTQITLEDDDEATNDAVNVGSVVRGKLRVGFDAGRFLPYVTAGVAQARLNADDETFDAALEDSYNGRFIGIGANYMLNDRLMVGVEALRHDFEDTPALEGMDTDFSTSVNTISLRGSIRF